MTPLPGPHCAPEHHSSTGQFTQRPLITRSGQWLARPWHRGSSAWGDIITTASWAARFIVLCLNNVIPTTRRSGSALLASQGWTLCVAHQAAKSQNNITSWREFGLIVKRLELTAKPKVSTSPLRLTWCFSFICHQLISFPLLGCLRGGWASEKYFKFLSKNHLSH